MGRDGDVGVLLEEEPILPDHRGADRDLVVGLGVHEVVDVAIVVQVLDLALLDPRARPARAGLEGALDDVAATHVLELHAHLGGAARHLDVGPVEDLHQLTVELDDHAFLDVPGVDHAGDRLPRLRVTTPGIRRSPWRCSRAAANRSWRSSATRRACHPGRPPRSSNSRTRYWRWRPPSATPGRERQSARAGARR